MPRGGVQCFRDGGALLLRTLRFALLSHLSEEYGAQNEHSDDDGDLACDTGEGRVPSVVRDVRIEHRASTNEAGGEGDRFNDPLRLQVADENRGPEHDEVGHDECRSKQSHSKLKNVHLLSFRRGA